MDSDTTNKITELLEKLSVLSYHYVKSSLKNRDNKSFALILSFLFSGVGISYLGNVGKGLTIFAVSLILIPLRIYSSFGLMFSVFSFLLWAYGMYATNLEYNRIYKS